MPTRSKHDWDAAYARLAALAPNERSYQKLADELGAAKRTVERAAAKYGWTAKLAKVDAEVSRRSEQRVIRDRSLRVADTLRVIDAARTRFAGQLSLTDFRLTGSDFVGLIKLEQLLEGEATDNVALVEVQAGFRAAMRVAIETAGAVAAERLDEQEAAAFIRRFREVFLPAVNEALAIGPGE